MTEQESAQPDTAARGRFRIDQHSRPYTHLGFKNDPEHFQFALVSDNSGGGRPGVLQAASRLLNELQPEFVVNLGDLVEGYNDPGGFPASVETYRTWWREIDAALAPLETPFFFVPGNHDLNNPASLEVWRERLGGTRDYYHFRYQDVLFLVVNTEDPPKDTDHVIENDPEQAAILEASYHAVKDAIAASVDVETILAAAQPIEDFFGVINISDTQVDYFAEVLADNADVRWTFVLMHAPAWSTSDGLERDPQQLRPHRAVPRRSAVHRVRRPHAQVQLHRTPRPRLHHHRHDRRHERAAARSHRPCRLGHDDRRRPQDRQPAAQRNPRQVRSRRGRPDRRAGHVPSTFGEAAEALTYPVREPPGRSSVLGQRPPPLDAPSGGAPATKRS